MPLFRDRSDRPGCPAEAVTGATTGTMTGATGTMTGKTVAAAGPGSSGSP